MNASVAYARLRFWSLWLAGWIALGLWLGVNSIIGRRNAGMPIAAWQPLCWELSSTLVMAVLCVVAYKFEQRFPLSGPGSLRRLSAHVPAAFVFSAVHTSAMVSIRKLVYAMAGSHYDFGDPLLGFAYELQKDLISYAIVVGVCIALRTDRARRARELAVLRLERDLSDARLAQLTAQIEPHFVFNTLNAISNRMHEDVEAADRLLAAFADLLRSALRDSGQTTVRAADDVAWLERYFALMGERFRGRLATRIALDPAAADARIPRLLLQPLVENAFRHGLTSGKGRIDVRIEPDGARLRCTVEDDGVGLRGDHAPGIGLANVRRRLELMYPDDHTFRIEPRPQGGTRVSIELPLERHD
ncbi:MAG TPA: histidine kinase [Rudaea sp.]|nr:histidine kinase [Rudaea sp.]